MIEKPRIVFFGTPEFAVGSLEIIANNDFHVVAVVTAPDKPAGRGLKLKSSPVKEFAIQHNIPVLQPVNLKEPIFHAQLQAFAPDLQVVVAFRMLPKEVWDLPPMGTFNLHASLLPEYRGAAPINWVLINGEKESGVTTFFLEETIDTGNILFSERISISVDETAGELHDRLKTTGAGLVLKTIRSIVSGNHAATSQKGMTDPSVRLKVAPKIRREDCMIDWGRDVVSIHNLIRGLSPHPGAFCEIKDVKQNALFIKIFRAEPEVTETMLEPGTVVITGKTQMKIAARNGFILLKEIQMTGHKVMAIADFLNGFGRCFV
jgi:methionyl-tRNA formyltransferase